MTFKSGDAVYYINDDQVRHDGKVRTFAELCKIISGKEYKGRALQHASEAGANDEQLYVVWNKRIAGSIGAVVAVYSSLSLLESSNIKLMKCEPRCHLCGKSPVQGVIHTCDRDDIVDQSARYRVALERVCMNEMDRCKSYEDRGILHDGDSVVSTAVINDARETLGWRKV